MRKLRDADAVLNAGNDLAAVLQNSEIGEPTYQRSRNLCGGMKAAEAVRLKKLKGENVRLKQLVAEKEPDIHTLKFVTQRESPLQTKNVGNTSSKTICG